MALPIVTSSKHSFHFSPTQSGLQLEVHSLSLEEEEEN